MDAFRERPSRAYNFVLKKQTCTPAKIPRNIDHFDAEAHKKALKASDEWNTTEVTAKADGSIELRLNGVPVSTGKSELTSGPIGFQSEGARIHLKDIKIKMLD